MAYHGGAAMGISLNKLVLFHLNSSAGPAIVYRCGKRLTRRQMPQQ
jgi:hypothetical protein